MTRRVVRNAVKFNRGIPWDEGLVRSSAKDCRPAQCRLRSQPRNNPSLATVRGERKFVRQHEKELSRRAGVRTVVCGQGCMTRPNDALRSRLPDLFELSSTVCVSEEAEQEGIDSFVGEELPLIFVPVSGTEINGNFAASLSLAPFGEGPEIGSARKGVSDRAVRLDRRMRPGLYDATKRSSVLAMPFRASLPVYLEFRVWSGLHLRSERFSVPAMPS
ncbi:hypothetical protein NPIL_211181 [Nephila pilipes]|uniref:Uncharacterized protein n=1 Tax=Nephila pilipes TaxID=299642 RepID=A0A8X6TTN9_NEPPI|nr:hypothetical protein NPIL_211181 [Nephila pilipes]